LRVLSVVRKHYYGRPEALEPLYLEFTDPLRDLGHEVAHFDHFAARDRFGVAGCGERFLRLIETERYDAVLYQTSDAPHMPPDAISAARDLTTVIAWNSDDDWQWDTVTSHLAPSFSYMVTTYRHIYDQNRGDHPNLLLSQWGCYDRLADFSRPKDLDFTFAGNLYGSRNRECRLLAREAGLRVYGTGARLVRLGLPYVRGVSRLRRLYGEALTFEEINDVWNRSRISFTPMAASVDDSLLQIKSRCFEMGLSGTLMLCPHAPDLEDYYEPGREFVSFTTLEECMEKARFYLDHERERAPIAEAYRNRTRAEHLWQHRFKALFGEIGLS
jgi:spore maturation protein CgeB